MLQKVWKLHSFSELGNLFITWVLFSSVSFLNKNRTQGNYDICDFFLNHTHFVVQTLILLILKRFPKFELFPGKVMFASILLLLPMTRGTALSKMTVCFDL